MSTIDTAIVLAIPIDGAGPFDRFAGLPLVLRTILALQKAGITTIFVLGSERDDAMLRGLADDPRVTSTLLVHAAPSRVEGAATLAHAVSTPFVMTGYEIIASPELYARLRAVNIGDRHGIVAVAHDKRLGPLAGRPSLLEELAHMTRDEENVGALGSVTLRARGAMETAMTRLFGDGRVAPLEVSDVWAYRADNVDGRDRAFVELFDACRKPVDGLVSRYLNRHVSIWISKRLVDTPVTPNQMSVFTLLLAFLGGFLVLQGTYFSMLAGAFAFQWNSILDGVDGELARVRFQQSKLGQWIDTICDDVSNLVFYGALTLAAQTEPARHELTIAGSVAMASIALTMLINYTELASLGSGDFYALDWQKTAEKSLLVAFFERLLKKDAFIFFYLVMAGIGLLPLTLFVAATGHGIAFGAAVVRRLSAKRKR